MENVEAWAQLLIQVPLVGVFIWYSLRIMSTVQKMQSETVTIIQQIQKDFAAALDRRDDLYEERNQVLVKAIEANTAQVAKLTEVTYRGPTPAKRTGD